MPEIIMVSLMPHVIAVAIVVTALIVAVGYIVPRQKHEIHAAAGIIRPDGSGGWYILNDGDHVPLNLASIEVHPEQVLVHFAKPFRQLITFHVGVDDDMARTRIMAGASTGLGKIGIVLTDKNGVIDPTTVTNPLANIQIKVTGYAP